jgi:neutral ceramidase
MSYLRAGGACVDITPALGTHLSGSGMGDHRPAKTVLDPLFAKVVIFESVDRRLCIAALDVTIIAGDYTAKIRSAISVKTGVPPDAVLVHATQTHSAPSVGYFMLDPDFPLETTPESEYLRGCESGYADFAADAVIRAAVEAADRMQPVRLGYGRAILADLAFNRRGIRRDGTIMMPKPLGRDKQPLGITDLCYLEGPMDPEVGVLCVQGMDKHVVALLLHHTCHPVNVFGQQDTYCAVSADWPGAWADEMRTAFGSDVVPLVLNGCCGNINPWHPFDPDCRPDHRRMGRELGSMTQKVIQSMNFSEDDALLGTVRHVPLSYRDIPLTRKDEVAEILRHDTRPPRGENGEVDPRWFLAASTRSVELCRRREPEFLYEIQVFRIGDLAVVGLPGEPFVEGQLDIKVGSTAPYTFAAHLTTRYVGYLPTREAYTRGGHEANEDVTYWAKLAPGSLETISETAVAMIEELFP